VLINAALLGMLGSIDCLLTCLVSDSLTRTEHNSNKELVGQGFANIAAGLCGALPGSGATTATVVNIQAGGRTGLSGILRAVILALLILAGSGLASRIPLAVLAAIVFKVGIDIVDWGFLGRVPQLSRKGALITYVVIALTVLVDLMVAVGVGHLHRQHHHHRQDERHADAMESWMYPLKKRNSWIRATARCCWCSWQAR
jgi:SulP family sulfate permease